MSQDAALPPPPPYPINQPEPLLPLPSGFFPRLDFFLQHPEQISRRLRGGIDLGPLIGMFFWMSLANCAVYGAVMGSSNLLQGAPMLLWQKLTLIPISGFKVPTLFLLTLFIVIPPIYVSNAFAGGRLGFRQLLATMLGSIALASTLLASLATVAFFFALTTLSYHFIKLLHVAFFAYACGSGLAFLFRQLGGVAGPGGRVTPWHLKFVWLILYAFVGTQLAWVLRPFIAAPTEPFAVVRDRSGSFYEGVTRSAFLLLTGESEKRAEGPMVER